MRYPELSYYKYMATKELQDLYMSIQSWSGQLINELDTRDTEQNFKPATQIVTAVTTTDIGRPNGATHWVAVTGKDREDHLMLYDKLQKNPKFMKLISSRGEFEDVKDFELQILRRKQ